MVSALPESVNKPRTNASRRTKRRPDCFKLKSSLTQTEPTPSEADITVTRDLIRAGQLLKIDVLDHVIVGRDRHSSLRELGYFFC